MQHHGWSRLPAPEDIDDGLSGARLDRPALDRLRDAARRGELDAVVIWSPDRLARTEAHQGLLSEAFEKVNTPLSLLQNPFGDSPHGKLRTQMPGMIAEYERAQMAERTRRGRVEKARHGEFIPWAYSGDGYRSLPNRHGSAPQVMIEPLEAAGVRDIYGAVVEEHLRCRQLTQRLNASQTLTPTGKNHVWHPATVRNLLTTRVSAGPARDNDRQPVIPPYRQRAAPPRRYLQTGRRDRAESAWVVSDAPASITVALFDKAPRQLQRNAEAARKLYQPTARRYVLRTRVTCGECGLGRVCIRQLSVGKKDQDLDDECKGHSPLTVGRPPKCDAKRVRADRLEAVVWPAWCPLRRHPHVIPPRHQAWAEATQQHLSALEAQPSQRFQRQQRIERQDPRVLEASQAEVLNLRARQTRRQKRSAEWQQIEPERRQ
jgi:site-specific DNA recombinase